MSDDDGVVSVCLAILDWAQQTRSLALPFNALPSVDIAISANKTLEEALTEAIVKEKQRWPELETSERIENWYFAFSDNDIEPINWLDSAMHTKFGYDLEGRLVVGTGSRSDLLVSDIIRANPAPANATEELHVVAVEPLGLGGAPDIAIPLLEFLTQHRVFIYGVFVGALQSTLSGGIVRISGQLSKSGRQRIYNRRVNKIADEWVERGISHPRVLREFIDQRESWGTDEISKRLHVDPEEAARLLKALGFRRRTGEIEWRRSTRSKDVQRREKWIRDETR